MTIFAASSASVAAPKKNPLSIDMRRLGTPLLPCPRFRVEDGPDRPASIVLVADPGHRRVDPVGGPVGHVFRVQVAAAAELSGQPAPPRPPLQPAECSRTI